MSRKRELRNFNIYVPVDIYQKVESDCDFYLTTRSKLIRSIIQKHYGVTPDINIVEV